MGISAGFASRRRNPLARVDRSLDPQGGEVLDLECECAGQAGPGFDLVHEGRVAADQAGQLDLGVAMCQSKPLQPLARMTLSHSLSMTIVLGAVKR